MTNPETSFNPMNTHRRLVLTRPHTHAGKTHGPGGLIEVDVPTADWLLAHGIAQHASAQHAIAAPSTVGSLPKPAKPGISDTELSHTTPRKESQS